MMMPSDYETVVTAEDFDAYLRQQDGDKAIWLMTLKELADTKNVDEFLANWNTLGLTGNRYARQYAEELLQERRDKQVNVPYV